VKPGRGRHAHRRVLLLVSFYTVLALLALGLVAQAVGEHAQHFEGEERVGLDHRPDRFYREAGVSFRREAWPAGAAARRGKPVT